MKAFSADYVNMRMLPNGKAMLLSDFSYENEKIKVTAKAGFIFDGASTPRFFWRVIGHPFSYRLLRPALIHDICYATECFERTYSDDLFSEMLEFAEVDDIKEDVMYLAVRVGGDNVWREHTEQGILDALKFIEITEK